MLKDCGNRAAVVDAVVKEQFIEVLPEEVRVWVKERKPRTTQEAGRLAEGYRQARKVELWSPAPKSSVKKRLPIQRSCYSCGQPGHLAKDCSSFSSSGKKESTSTSSKGEDVGKMEKKLKKDGKPLVCYNCGGRGHTSRQCPSESLYCGTRKSGNHRGRRQMVRQPFHCEGFVEGQFVDDIVLDTGFSRTLVRSDLVGKERLNSEKSVTVQCSHGDVVEYPVATVEIRVQGRRVTVEAAVSDKLPHSVLLGTDVPELVSWLKKEDKALMVVTRSQSRRQPNSEVAVESITTESRAEAEVEDVNSVPLSEETVSTEANVLSREYNFEDDVFVGGEKDKGPKETRSEKRKRRYEHARAKKAQEGDLDLDLTKEELRTLQEEDPLIQNLRKSRPDQVVEQGGLWYSLWRKKHPPGQVVLVLLPTTSNKLLAQWLGPYRVLRRVGEVNYKVYMPDKRKRRAVLHINMLKKWNQPEAMCLWTVGVDPDEENDVPTWRGEESGRSPSVGTQLTVQQKRQLLELLSDFKSVMSGRCGRTCISQHHIRTTGGLPVRQWPYRMPHAYRDTVERELEMMLREGVIEPCVSEWASPMVIIKKKDDTIRLYYRRLNPFKFKVIHRGGSQNANADALSRMPASDEDKEGGV